MLNLQAHEVNVYDNEDDIGCMLITLPFHKNVPVGSKCIEPLVPLPADLFWTLGIPPFVLQELPEQMAHLCPVRAFSAWISASRINKGNLFPNIDKHDRPVTTKSTAMVKYEFYMLWFILIQNFVRKQRSSCNSFEITCGIWISYHIPMAHILFAMVDASGLHANSVGRFDRSANGAVGVRTFHT